MGDDESFDLDDDLGLDDDDGGGDDFAGSFDDALGDDLDDDDGGGESNSELDSFFEDLSSIEEMDSAEPAAAPPETAAPAAAAPTAAAPAEAASPASSGSKKKIFMMVATLLLLCGIGGGAWFFMQPSEEIAVEDLALEDPAPIEQVVQVERPKMAVPAPVPRRVEPAPMPAYVPPPVQVVRPKTLRYLIQVATCSFDKCKDEFAQELRKVGEPVYYKSTGEKFDFIELITSDVFSFRDANELVYKINRTNKLPGAASVVSQSNGYRVTLGTFPSLERAKTLKFHLEKQLNEKNLRFNLEHVKKNYETIKVYAGPYDNKGAARKALKGFGTQKAFSGAFMVRF